MGQSSALVLWLFLRAALFPQDPASLSLPNNALPSSRSAYGWLETTAPNIISSAFDAGGLTAGRAPALGIQGTSGVDTTFRFNGLDATSALRPGTPMILPDVVGAASIGVTRMGADLSSNAPGPVVDWRAVDGEKRIGVFEAFFMPRRFAITPGPGAQPIEQLQDYQDGSLLLAGQLQPGLSNAMFAAHWAKAQKTDHAGTAFSGKQLSILGNVTFTPSEIDRGNVLVAIQEGARGADTDKYGAAQVGWTHGKVGAARLELAGGYQWLDAVNVPRAAAAIDSALDGAVFPALFRPAGTERAWRGRVDFTAPLTLGGLSHAFRVGTSLDRSAMDPTLATTAVMSETVDGMAARVWRVDIPATPSHWTLGTTAAYASDRIGGDHAWVEVGARVERLTGANVAGTAAGITWTNAYPYASLRLSSARSGFGVFATYTRSGARLPAMALAFGDANAPSARVFRWTDPNQNGRVDGSEALDASDLVARVGPGAAGSLTAIAPDLRRPVFDTAIAGVSYEKPRVSFTVSAIVRRGTSQIRAIADGGAAYTTVTQPDANADYKDPSDDRLLAAFSRTPASFGLDHYTLTNTLAADNRSYALDIAAQYRGARGALAFSASAIAASGTAASRGFRADENDLGLIGDVFMNPNATTNATDARPFFDRGYVGKLVGILNFSPTSSLGVVARYQDGQPFARLAIFDNLNQGPEAVAAYPPGQPTRFTFISTTDVRLQQAFPAGNGQFVLVIDAFNVFNVGREVAEYVLTNAAFRTTTAIEPPRTIRIGVRITF